MELSAVVRKVIHLGDASRAYWDRELPRYHPHYPVIGAGEKATPTPPEDIKIHDLLKSLPENQLYALMLLTYVGRGDFRIDNLLPAKQRIKEIFPTRDLVIAQLTGEKTLAEYLTDAMEEIDKHHIDIDTLEFANAMPVS